MTSPSRSVPKAGYRYEGQQFADSPMHSIVRLAYNSDGYTPRLI